MDQANEAMMKSSSKQSLKGWMMFYIVLHDMCIVAAPDGMQAQAS